MNSLDDHSMISQFKMLTSGIIDQHWSQEANKQQSSEFITKCSNLGHMFYTLAGLKCYQYKIDLGHGNFTAFKKALPISDKTINRCMQRTELLMWKLDIVPPSKKPKKKENIIKVTEHISSLNLSELTNLMQEVEEDVKALEQHKKELSTFNEFRAIAARLFNIADGLLQEYKVFRPRYRNEFDELVQQFANEANGLKFELEITNYRYPPKLVITRSDFEPDTNGD